MTSQTAESHDLVSGIAQRNTAVVLVTPKDSKNVGAVARAMSNFGFSDLRLVAEEPLDFEAARVSACWATDVLESLQYFQSLPDAVADCADVIGFSSSYGKNRTAHLPLRDCVADILANPFPGRLGLVFGPEDTGLLNVHVPHCRTLVRIPSNGANPSLNLAQAVLVALYEFIRTDAEFLPATDGVSWEEYTYLDSRIRSILTLSGFHTEHTPEQVPEVLLGLFKRMRASKREMAMLQGMFKKIERQLEKSV